MTAASRPNANLIVILDAILTHRNLTRAGESIGMAQPSMSGALSRLRELLGDPLLVRSGRISELTPTAESLIPLVRQALIEVEQIYATRSDFDPASSRRFFLVSASEEVIVELGASVAAILHREAPLATVDFEQVSDPDAESLESLLQRRDAVILPGAQSPSSRKLSLYSERLVIVVDQSHPLLDGDRLENEALRGMQRIVGAENAYSARAAEMLEIAGVSPTPVVCGAPTAVLPQMVIGTPYFAVVPERMALRAIDSGITIAVTGGLRSSTIVEAAHWHVSRSDDAALQWFLKVLRRAAEDVEFPEGLDAL